MHATGMNPEMRKKTEEIGEKVANLLEDLNVVPVIGIAALVSICYNVTPRLIEQIKRNIEQEESKAAQ
ncbi:MAG: hypothetical protein AB1510_07730 [Bacillota bacterium]